MDIEERKELVLRNTEEIIQEEELEEILERPPKAIWEYPSYFHLIKNLEFMVQIAHRFNLLNGIFQGGRFS